jgi:hypothetical protein
MVDRVNLDLAVMIDHYLHQPVFFPYGVLEIWISWFNDHLFAIQGLAESRNQDNHLGSNLFFF